MEFTNTESVFGLLKAELPDFLRTLTVLRNILMLSSEVKIIKNMVSIKDVELKLGESLVIEEI